MEDKKFSAAFGLGLFAPILAHEGVTFPDAEFIPETDPGLTYFLLLITAINDNLYIGIGFNGNYAKGGFVKNAIVEDNQIDGYLEAGAVANTSLLLNLTYSPTGEGWKPYGKLGVGYFIEQVELGDVPLNLTDNVEFELFPDYKSTGFGILPEVGAKYNDFSVSVGFGFPFTELTGEVVPEAYQSTGTMTSYGLQVNAAYRVFLF